MGKFSDWIYVALVGGFIGFLSFKGTTLDSIFGRKVAQVPEIEIPEKTSHTNTIAIVDSFFCLPSYYEKRYPNITIEFITPMPQSFDENCDEYEKDKEWPEKMHGHLVFENVFHDYQGPKIKVLLANVFNRVGLQHTPYWKQALKLLNSIRPNFIVMAIGYFKDTQLDGIKIESPLFLASGNEGRGLDQRTILYPHKQNFKNYIIIAGAKEPRFVPTSLGDSSAKGHQFYFDPSTLNSGIVDFFLKDQGQKNSLTSSSFAVSYFANSVLKRCSDISSLNSLKSCFEQQKKEIKFIQSSRGGKSKLTFGFTF